MFKHSSLKHIAWKLKPHITHTKDYLCSGECWKPGEHKTEPGRARSEKIPGGPGQKAFGYDGTSNTYFINILYLTRGNGLLMSILLSDREVPGRVQTYAVSY